MNLGAGEWKAIVGPNGAGKSTLLKALATLVPYRGSIRYRGRPISEAPLAYRSELGVVLHEPLLYRELSAWENLLFYARLYGVAEPRRSRPAGPRRSGFERLRPRASGPFLPGDDPAARPGPGDAAPAPVAPLWTSPSQASTPEARRRFSSSSARAKEAQVAALWVTHRWRVAWEIVDEIVELERGAVRRITRTAGGRPGSWEPSYLEEGAR